MLKWSSLELRAERPRPYEQCTEDWLMTDECIHESSPLRINCAVMGENYPQLDGFRVEVEVGVVFVDWMSLG